MALPRVLARHGAFAHQCNKRGEARNAVTVWPHGHCGTGRLAFRGPRLPGEYRRSPSCPANVCRDHHRDTMSKSVAAKPRRRILCRTTFVCASIFCRFHFGQHLLSTERCRQELFLRYVTLARGPQIGQRFRRSVSSVHCTHKARACSLFSGRINRLFTRLSHLVLHAPHARPSAPSQQDKRHSPLSHHPHSPSLQSLFEMERPSRHTHGFVQHDGSVVAVSLQPYHSSGRAAATAVGSLVGAFAAPMQSTGLIPIVPSHLMDGVCSYRPRRQAGSRRHEAVFFFRKAVPSVPGRLLACGWLGSGRPTTERQPLPPMRERSTCDTQRTALHGRSWHGRQHTCNEAAPWTAACSIERSVRHSQLAKMQEEVGVTFSALLNTTHHAEASATTTLRTCARGKAPRRQLPAEEQHALPGAFSKAGSLVPPTDIAALRSVRTPS